MANGNVGQIFLTRIWLFQGIVAAPTFIILGIMAIVNLYNTWDTIYDFITHLCTSIMAAGIIFVVLVQRKHATASRQLIMQFEIAKSGLATALWIWLMADAIWGPRSHYGYYQGREKRIISSAIAVLLLFIFFYPTLFYTIRHRNDLPMDTEAIDGNEAGERGPLLQNQSA